MASFQLEVAMNVSSERGAIHLAEGVKKRKPKKALSSLMPVAYAKSPAEKPGKFDVRLMEKLGIVGVH